MPRSKLARTVENNNGAVLIDNEIRLDTGATNAQGFVVSNGGMTLSVRFKFLVRRKIMLMPLKNEICLVDPIKYSKAVNKKTARIAGRF